MRDRDMKRLLSLMSQLTFNQQMKLRDELFRQSAAAEMTQVIDSQGSEVSQCPHCRSERLVRNGQADGLQRYKCRGCGKTLNARHPDGAAAPQGQVAGSVPGAE